MAHKALAPYRQQSKKEPAALPVTPPWPGQLASSPANLAWPHQLSIMANNHAACSLGHHPPSSDHSSPGPDIS